MLTMAVSAVIRPGRMATLWLSPRMKIYCDTSHGLCLYGPNCWSDADGCLTPWTRMDRRVEPPPTADFLTNVDDCVHRIFTGLVVSLSHPEWSSFLDTCLNPDDVFFCFFTAGPWRSSVGTWSEWFSLTAFLRTADIEVHIVHTSRLIIAYTLKSLSSLT